MRLGRVVAAWLVVAMTSSCLHETTYTEWVDAPNDSKRVGKWTLRQVSARRLVITNDATGTIFDIGVGAQCAKSGSGTRSVSQVRSTHTTVSAWSWALVASLVPLFAMIGTGDGTDERRDRRRTTEWVTNFEPCDDELPAGVTVNSDVALVLEHEDFKRGWQFADLDLPRKLDLSSQLKLLAHVKAFCPEAEVVLSARPRLVPTVPDLDPSKASATVEGELRLKVEPIRLAESALSPWEEEAVRACTVHRVVSAERHRRAQVAAEDAALDAKEAAATAALRANERARAESAENAAMAAVVVGGVSEAGMRIAISIAEGKLKKGTPAERQRASSDLARLHTQLAQVRAQTQALRAKAEAKARAVSAASRQAISRAESAAADETAQRHARHAAESARRQAEVDQQVEAAHVTRLAKLTFEKPKMLSSAPVLLAANLTAPGPTVPNSGAAAVPSQDPSWGSTAPVGTNGNGAADFAQSSQPQPTMACFTEADRFRFSEAGTYQITQLTAVGGPLRKASLCIEHDPKPSASCKQVLGSPLLKSWTVTVNSDNQLTMWGAEGSNAPGQLQTDCAQDNRARSYVAFHNPGRTASFTFRVEKVSASTPPPPGSPPPTMACLTDADRFRFAEAGTYEIDQITAVPGPLREASLCVEHDPRPADHCKQVVRGPLLKTWIVTVNSENQLTMWGREGTHTPGQLQTDCAEDNRPRSEVTFHDPSRTASFTFRVRKVNSNGAPRPPPPPSPPVLTRGQPPVPSIPKEYSDDPRREAFNYCYANGANADAPRSLAGLPPIGPGVRLYLGNGPVDSIFDQEFYDVFRTMLTSPLGVLGRCGEFRSLQDRFTFHCDCQNDGGPWAPCWQEKMDRFHSMTVNPEALAEDVTRVKWLYDKLFAVLHVRVLRLVGSGLGNSGYPNLKFEPGAVLTPDFCTPPLRHGKREEAIQDFSAVMDACGSGVEDCLRALTNAAKASEAMGQQEDCLRYNARLVAEAVQLQFRDEQCRKLTGYNGAAHPRIVVKNVGPASVPDANLSCPTATPWPEQEDVSRCLDEAATQARARTQAEAAQTPAAPSSSSKRSPYRAGPVIRITEASYGDNCRREQFEQFEKSRGDIYQQARQALSIGTAELLQTMCGSSTSSCAFVVSSDKMPQSRGFLDPKCSPELHFKWHCGGPPQRFDRMSQPPGGHRVSLNCGTAGATNAGSPVGELPRNEKGDDDPRVQSDGHVPKRADPVLAPGKRHNDKQSGNDLMDK